MWRNEKLNENTMQYLQNMLRELHHYSVIFLHAFEILERVRSRELNFCIVANAASHNRRYNEPVVDEIAIVLPGQDNHAHDPRDILLHSRSGEETFIHDHYPTYIPLHYVLLFPYGTPSWTYNLPLTTSTQDAEPDNERAESHKQSNISQAQYYSYQLHIQQSEFSTLQSGSMLRADFAYHSSTYVPGLVG
jgi:hypothetical protein